MRILTTLITAFLLMQNTVCAEESWHFIALADWQDILPTDDWLAEIYRDIEAAGSFLFIISPDSVASDIYGLETEHAV